MPKCDSCGFAHAQSNHCINCGSTDPLRRHRAMRLGFLVGSLLIAALAVYYFYQRYNQIERSVRDAQMSAQDAAAVYTTPEPPDKAMP